MFHNRAATRKGFFREIFIYNKRMWLKKELEKYKNWFVPFFAIISVTWVVFLVSAWAGSTENSRYLELIKLLPLFSTDYYFSGSTAKALPGNISGFFRGLLFFISLYGYGRFALCLIKKKFSFSEKIIYAVALGFALTGGLAFFLAAAGLLYTAVLSGIITAGLVTGIISIFKMKPHAPSMSVRNRNGPAFAHKGSFSGIISAKCFFSPEYLCGKLLPLLVLAICCFMTLCGALSPEPCGNDALNYHLAAPNYWLIHHGFADMPQHMFYNLFMLHGAVWATALGTVGLGGLKIYNFFLGIVSLFAVFHIVKKYSSINAALMTVALLASCPSFADGMVKCGTEIPVFLFITASLLVMLGLTDRYDNGCGDSSPITVETALAGFFSGCAVAVKASSLFFSAAVAIMLVYSVFKEKRRNTVGISGAEMMRNIVVFVIFLIIPVIPWLVKNFVYRGNPFFPFLTSVFGVPEGYSIQNISTWLADVNNNAKGTGSFFYFLKNLFHLFIPEDGNIYNAIVPFFLPAWLPFFILRPPSLTLPLRRIAVFALSGFLLMFSTVHIFRFLLPVYAAALVLTAHQIENTLSGIFRNCAYVFTFICCLACMLMYHSMLFRQGLYEVPFGIQNMAGWMRDHCPVDNVRLYPEIDALMDKNDKVLLINSGTAFYIMHDYEAFSFYDQWPLQKAAHDAGGGDEMYRLLKSRGITHILYDKGSFINTFAVRNITSDHTAAEIIHEFWNSHLETVKKFHPLPYQQKYPSYLYRVVEERKGKRPEMLYPDF